MINILRWLAIIPVAVLSAIIIPIIIKLMTQFGFFSYKGSEAIPLYVELGASFFMGATFVFIGKSIAPNKKILVAQVLFILSIVIFSTLFYLNWQLGETLSALCSLPALLGAYLAKDYEF